METVELKQLQANQKGLENLCSRRFITAPSFEIYGSAAGLFDFGPVGCAIKNEFESIWRRHFVLEEDLLEIAGPNLTPHAVLKASGHVDRFLDLMTEDVVTRECYRADKIIDDVLTKMIGDIEKSQQPDSKVKAPAFTAQEIELVLAQVEGMDADQMYDVIQKFGIKSTVGNDLSKPYPFNLMFGTKLGPKTSKDENDTHGVAYLRPETAQGIFVNFKRLLEQSGGKVPFGGACVGTSFRNEIAPRNGLLRVREFPMAEIEYFCDPLAKRDCPKFDTVEDITIPIYSRERQASAAGAEAMTLAQAIERGIIDNETLAYFIGRTYLFLTKVGINPSGLRFRQHLSTEMAHYAQDCWDAEILTSYKWVECVGIADRSAYDLTQHAKATGTALMAARILPEPIEVDVFEARPNKKLLGPAFKKEAKAVEEALNQMTEEQKAAAAASLKESGKMELVVGDNTYTLEDKHVEFVATKVKKLEETFVPNVIEPSFGIGRIITAILEHAYDVRENDADRGFLKLSPAVAPIKCSILPISNKATLNPFINKLRSNLLSEDLSVKIDASGASIGKRYARTDEVGIPFGCTVDFQTVEDNTVTLRELVSTEQVRLPISEVASTVRALVRGEKSWEQVKETFPIFTQQVVAN